MVGFVWHKLIDYNSLEVSILAKDEVVLLFKLYT
jgi:hypothetical protein